jgi:hypothetical protein
VATAVILESLARTGRASLRASIAPTANSGYRIFIYSLKLFGLNLVAGSLGSFLYVWTLQLQNSWAESTSASLKFVNGVQQLNLPAVLSTLLLAIGVAVIITPIAVRLIQPPDTVPAPNQANRARVAGIFAAVAISILSFLVSTLETPLFQQQHPTSSLFIYAIGMAATLITAIPNIPLYIALYLIATPDSPFTIPESPGLLQELPQSPPSSIAR